MVRCSEGAEESSSRTLARDLPESALEEEEAAAAVGGEGGCGERGARPGEQCKDGFSEQPVGAQPSLLAQSQVKVVNAPIMVQLQQSQ